MKESKLRLIASTNSLMMNFLRKTLEVTLVQSLDLAQFFRRSAAVLKTYEGYEESFWIASDGTDSPELSGDSDLISLELMSSEHEPLIKFWLKVI